MLVLTRKLGEGIAIGDDIKIIVMQIKGRQVRLGVKASSSTSVHREEVFQRIKDENRNASRANLDLPDLSFGMASAGHQENRSTSLRIQHKGKK